MVEVRNLAILLAAVALVTVPTVLLAGRYTTSTLGPLTWYVSRDGNGRGGSSWATAWPEPNRIRWSLVGPGDHIVIDGGRKPCPSNYLPRDGGAGRPGVDCGMLYRSTLAVRAGGIARAPVTIALSTAAGRDGTAVFFGGRTTPLPYCDQPTYAPAGRAHEDGIRIRGHTHVVIDGTHRSGIMVYGAQTGVDLADDNTGNVTLRNLEIFDNGTYEVWLHGYRTDGEGIALAGHDITIDRDLIHDNGQDAIQDTSTGVSGNHAPLSDITVTNSWLYEHREHPHFPGYGFNSGPQEIAAHDCTHVDGLQIWGGGLHQQRMTFAHDVFGPFLAQGIYPGDDNKASFDHVTITDALFLNPLDHAILGARIASDRTTPKRWRISRITSYLTDEPNRGLSTHGKIDLAGTGHSLTNSLFYNGYFHGVSTFETAHDNVWWRGNPVPGGIPQPPQFAGPMPTVNWPSYAELTRMNLAPHCPACSGVGSKLHDVSDLLARIDHLDRAGHR